MKIKPIFAWYDCWVGFYWDQIESKLYFLPLPMVGLIFDFSKEDIITTFEAGTLDFSPDEQFKKKVADEMKSALTQEIKQAYYSDPERKV